MTVDRCTKLPGRLVLQRLVQMSTVKVVVHGYHMLLLQPTPSGGQLLSSCFSSHPPSSSSLVAIRHHTPVTTEHHGESLPPFLGRPPGRLAPRRRRVVGVGVGRRMRWEERQ